MFLQKNEDIGLDCFQMRINIVIWNETIFLCLCLKQNQQLTCHEKNFAVNYNVVVLAAKKNAYFDAVLFSGFYNDNNGKTTHFSYSEIFQTTRWYNSLRIISSSSYIYI